MKKAVCNDLSYGDALFLYLERPGTPLNIASVAIFKGVISTDDLVAFVESKLPQLPRYMQKVFIPPLNLGLPRWEFDQSFDIANHIHEVTLKRGTDAELRELAGRVLSPLMDRNKPLWDLTIVRGLQGDRTGLIVRIHHSMADGIGGVSMLNSLMDASPVAPKLRRRRLKIPTPVSRDAIGTMVEGLVNSWFEAVQRVLAADSEILLIANRLIAMSRNQQNDAPPNEKSGDDGGSPEPSFQGFSKLFPELAAPAQRLPFNRVCQGPQKFTWAQIPFDRLKAVKLRSEVTINDVLLTVVSAAYKDYAQLCGADTADRSLRIIIPVNTRGHLDGSQLGNRITFAPIDVPLGVKTVKRLVAEIHRRTQAMKTTGLGELVAFLGTLLSTIPAPLQAVAMPLISQLPISICNVICTNVPGPKYPLYMLGHEMLQCFPYVPIGGEMGINCAVLTYNGNAFFGFSGDSAVTPGFDRLSKAVVKNFEDLEANLGIKLAKPARKVRSTAKVPVPVQVEMLAPVAAEEPEKVMAVAAAAGD